MRAGDSVGAHRTISGLALGAALVACGRSQNKTTGSAAGNAVPAPRGRRLQSAERRRRSSRAARLAGPCYSASVTVVAPTPPRSSTR